MSKKWTPKSRASELHSQRAAPGMFKGNGPTRHTSVKEHLRGTGSAKKLNDIQGAAGQNVDYAVGGGRSSGAFTGCRGYSYEK
jgi:hypothetical protein